MKYDLPIPDRVYVVISTLKDAGFESYLVGGAIRDHLMGRLPKDYDVSTAATPEEVREVFGRRRARIIGKRFRLVHLTVGNELFEVSTFRSAPHPGELPDGSAPRAGTPENLILSDNAFGTAKEDAWRRDFTVNALFYDPVEKELLDYTGLGLSDIKAGIVRAIGDPDLRFEEDPVRMLRALKLVGQYDFALEETTENALFRKLELLKAASPSRLSLELEKVLGSMYGDRQLEAFHDYGLLGLFLPELEKAWERPAGGKALQLLAERNCRVSEGKYRISVSLAMAAMALPFVEEEFHREPGSLWMPGREALPVIEDTLRKIFRPQNLMIRLFDSAVNVLKMQPYFTQPDAPKPSFFEAKSYAHARELFLIRSAVAGEDAAFLEEAWPRPVPVPRSRKRSDAPFAAAPADGTPHKRHHRGGRRHHRRRPEEGRSGADWAAGQDSAE